MKIIIIAAGSSSRLGNLTKEVPKGMLMINGKSVIERQLTILKNLVFLILLLLQVYIVKNLILKIYDISLIKSILNTMY